MQRDMDLVRKFLLLVENTKPSDGIPEVEGYDGLTVAHHIWLLIDAGLIHGTKIDFGHGHLPQGNYFCITWAGHDFLNAARNETTWHKAMAAVKQNAGTVTFQVLKVLLESYQKGLLHLPT